MFYIYLCHSKGREIITRSKTSTFGPIPCKQNLKYENKELQLPEIMFAKYIEPPLIYHQLSKFSTSTVTFLPWIKSVGGPLASSIIKHFTGAIFKSKFWNFCCTRSNNSRFIMAWHHSTIIDFTNTFTFFQWNKSVIGPLTSSVCKFYTGSIFECPSWHGCIAGSNNSRCIIAVRYIVI